MTTLMTAALPSGTAAPAHPSAESPIGLPTGLTEVDTARIAAAISAARTESTRTVYAHAWRGWERWCAFRGVPALPGDPVALCAYLTERAESGRAMGTLDLSCTAIRHVHRMCGAEDPVAAEDVRQVRLGLRRTYGSAPRCLDCPLRLNEIRQIVSGIDRTTPIGIRDAAIILLGYASAMRRSEIVALTLADIEVKPAGVLLHVCESKTDQEGHGQIVAVAHGQHALTDPVATLAAWRAVRGEEPGALFTRIWASSVSLEPLSGHVVARMLRARAEAAGLDGKRITAHSLRAGARHHRCPGRRSTRQDRRPHPPQGHLRPRHPLHPPARSTRDDIEQGPRPVTRFRPVRQHLETRSTRSACAGTLEEQGGVLR